MPHYTATVTARTGPASQVTAGVFTGVSAINYDFERGVVQLIVSNASGPQVKEFSLTGVTTITTNPAAGTVTIS